MKQFGKVEIPQEAFIGVLKINKEKKMKKIFNSKKNWNWGFLCFSSWKLRNFLVIIKLILSRKIERKQKNLLLISII